MLSKVQKIKSIEKALQIISLLSENTELGITDISKILKIGTTTVYRILTTLRYSGYIVQDEKTLKYSLGYKLFIVGNKVQNVFNILDIVTPYLKKLSKYTIEGINCSILKGDKAICIAKVESPEMLRTDIKIGSELPTHCTAVGKSILAFLPKENIDKIFGNNNDKLVNYTKNSISSLVELKNQLKTIRENGYAIDMEEYKTSVNCLGVPIINAKGVPIASISITGPSSRFDLSEMEKLKSNLISITKEISEKFK